MTLDEEYQMFDCSIEDLNAIVHGQRARGGDMTSLVFSMLSDIQEMLDLGMEKETIRRALNRAKYLLDKGRPS